MRICRVEIERFAGIRNLDLKINNSLQLIAGQNNSCKSTVLRAINIFFKGLDKIPPSNFAPQNSYYGGESNRALTRIRLTFNELTAQEKATFSSILSSRNGQFWVEVKISRAGSISHRLSKDGPVELYENLLDSFEIIYVPAVRAGSAARGEETRKLFITTKEVLATRRRRSTTKLQREFSEACNGVTSILSDLYEEGKNSISDGLPEDAELLFKFPSQEEILDLILSRTTIGTRANTELTVEDEGTGFQSLLSLGLLRYVESVARNTNLLFLVEEPEAFLHPQYQRSIAHDLTDLSKKSQVIVTTHSAVLVDSVDVTHIARLKRDSGGLQHTWGDVPIHAGQIGVLTRYCDAKNSEIIFADKVILCEGITDEYVFKSIVEKITGGNLHLQNISVISGGGDALRYISQLLDRLEVDHLIVMDKDCYAGEKRDLLKKLCKEKGAEISPAEYVALDKAKAGVSQSREDAASSRDKINGILAKRNLFALSSDIEGAICYSFSKKRILSSLGPTGLGHLSEESVQELNVLSGEALRERLNNLIGSKGWATKKANKNNKPKPHILAELVRLCGVENATTHSDLDALKGTFTSFLRP